MTEVPPGSIRAWILAARPATLTAAFAPVAVGTACAWRVGGFRWDAALAALLGAFLIQIATNFANDMFDFQKGADTEERLGPTRAAQAGLLTVRQLRRGIIVAFALALGTGIYLTSIAGPAVIVIGLASMAAGLAYTGGPFPLAYNGLGDVFVMGFFGFVAVCGTAFVQALSVPDVAWVASIPIGALATAILVVNNVRDFYAFLCSRSSGPSACFALSRVTVESRSTRRSPGRPSSSPSTAFSLPSGSRCDGAPCADRRARR